jgi:hypothetical protein
MTNTTQFTMDSKQVTTNLTVLQELCAVPMKVHASQWRQLCTCCSYGNESFVAEGTTFICQGTLSRNQLKKLLGKDAMVRGVKHL